MQDQIEISKAGRLRAGKDETYYYVDEGGQVADDIDGRHEVDDARWQLGNYFHRREDAEPVATAIRAYFSFIHTVPGRPVPDIVTPVVAARSAQQGLSRGV